MTDISLFLERKARIDIDRWQQYGKTEG